MPDSLATMLGLINDNTSGDISAADHRATIQALYDWIPDEQKYLVGRLADETPHADDDFFTAYSGYTEVVPSGTGTWTLTRNGVGVKFTGQSASHGVAALKAFTPSAPPVTFETAMSAMVKSGGSSAMAGLVLTDGTTTTSGAYWAGLGASHLLIGGGTTLSTLAQTTVGTGVLDGDGLVYIRVIWRASNSFARAYSLDGVQWTDFAASPLSLTMTPTHVGFLGSSWTIAGPHLATFRYLRVYEADLSV